MQSTPSGRTSVFEMNLMNPPTLQSQPETRPGRRPKAPADGDEFGKKPKKVNSEIRKQQNRIASRNYREKRKRKLQYLQRLVRDGSNDDEASEPSPTPKQAQLRAQSSEFEEAGPSSSPFLLPPATAYSLSPRGSVPLEPVPTPSTASFDGRFDANVQMYSAFESAWPASPYTPQPPSDTTWSVPSWAPHVDYSSRMASYPDSHQYAAPTGPPVFAHDSNVYQAQRMTNYVENYHVQGLDYDPYHNIQQQVSATSSSYFTPQSFTLDRSIYT